MVLDFPVSGIQKIKLSTETKEVVTCVRDYCETHKKGTSESLTVVQYKPGIREAVGFFVSCVIWEYFMLLKTGLAHYLLCLSGVLLENS